MLIVPLVVTTIVLKPAVVRLLYSPAFLPALEIMRWMLIGDYFMQHTTPSRLCQLQS